MMPVRKPRLAASRAIPAPVTPPPMTRISRPWASDISSRARARVSGVRATVATVPPRRNITVCELPLRTAHTCAMILHKRAPGGEQKMRDVQQAYRAATMYYLQNQTMEVIGSTLGVSRSTVSRLLAAAREAGLVQVSVRPPEHRSEERRVGREWGIVA